MKKLFAMVAMLILAGCSSLKTAQDYNPDVDFNKYKTYAWIVETEADAPYHLDGLMDERIRSSVEAQLAQDGFTKVSTAEADLLVNYFTKVEKKMDSTTFHSNFGYDPYWDGYWGYGSRTGMSHTRVREYKVGTLILDFVDASTKKLIWRGNAADTVKDNQTPAEATAQVVNAVTEMMKQYPPKPETK
ncbi:DUF4136 domain-containing protein [Paraferrimonas sp. SM1919]|uniref:DUF4136 domain-containing protein n=1 Tax=Paraferrimonas sp. SM1919 TaxID=2662263 RepID=UPI0013D1818F|nr:DUF4136 domain-containing protein [Paraferrimonas sp. SM1919]